jgi:hypothetical protein
MRRIPPVAFDALGIFEVALATGLAIGSVAIRAVISAVFWFSAALAISLVRGVAPSLQPPPSARGSFAASAVLLTLAAAFVAFPVLQPWSGLPEPFVRWHPYSTDAELVWRAIFLAFAIGMEIVPQFGPVERRAGGRRQSARQLVNRMDTGPHRRNDDPVAAGAFQSRDHAGPQERRLARSRRTQERDELGAPLRAPRVEALDQPADVVVAAENRPRRPPPERRGDPETASGSRPI